jgi:hypothetical protein
LGGGARRIAIGGQPGKKLERFYLEKKKKRRKTKSKRSEGCGSSTFLASARHSVQFQIPPKIKPKQKTTVSETTSAGAGGLGCERV